MLNDSTTSPYKKVSDNIHNKINMDGKINPRKNEIDRISKNIR